MRFTVLGADGYIGSHLSSALRAQSHEVHEVRRGQEIGDADELGHVLYCIAVTNDSEERAGESVHANVCLVLDLLRRARFESFLYLSSAQVYFGADRSTEDARLGLSPGERSELYRASKMMGEMLCHASARARVRVARLSAVYGERLSPRSFLAGVVRDAVTRGHVLLETSLDSARDFVHVDDVTRVLPQIALRGTRAVYNVASGRNTSNAELCEELRRETGCTVEVRPGAPRSSYPRVEIDRIVGELGFAPAAPVTAALGALVRAQRA